MLKSTTPNPRRVWGIILILPSGQPWINFILRTSTNASIEEIFQIAIQHNDYEALQLIVSKKQPFQSNDTIE